MVALAAVTGAGTDEGDKDSAGTGLEPAACPALPLLLASWRMPPPSATSASKAATAKIGLARDFCGGGGSEPSLLVSVDDDGPAGSDEARARIDRDGAQRAHADRRRRLRALTIGVLLRHADGGAALGRARAEQSLQILGDLARSKLASSGPGIAASSAVSISLALAKRWSGALASALSTTSSSAAG